jgi:hypothetical protein
MVGWWPKLTASYKDRHSPRIPPDHGLHFTLTIHCVFGRTLASVTSRALCDSPSLTVRIRPLEIKSTKHPKSTR